MECENSSRNNKVMAIVVAFLVAVAAVQGYYLFQMHNKLSGNVAYASEQKTDEKGWSLTPKGAIPDPATSVLNNSFDPNTWNPFKEMEEMQKQMDVMFEEAFGHFNASPHFNVFTDAFSFNPKSDIEENDHEYIVRMDIPGTDDSKIDAHLEDRTLTITGTREEEISSSGANKQLRSERRLGKFERVLTLPGPVNQEGFNAEYKDGVLTITIPKDTNASLGKSIKIL